MDKAYIIFYNSSIQNKEKLLMHKKIKLLPYIMTAATLYICLRYVVKNHKQVPEERKQA